MYYTLFLKLSNTTKLLFAYILIIIIWCGFSSCGYFRYLEKKKEDSTSVSKNATDSSALKQILSELQKNDSSKYRRDAEWSKDTYIYPRDTTVNNIYPTTVIRERGTERESEDKYSNMVTRDELLEILKASQSRSDSTSVKTEMKESTTKVRFSLFEIIILIALGLVVLKSLVNLKIPFKITTK